MGAWIAGLSMYYELRMRGLVRMVDEVRQDVLTLAVGNDDADTVPGQRAGRMVLGSHAPTSRTALFRLYVVCQVLVRLYGTYESRLRQGRVSGLESVNVAEQDEHVGLEHTCHESTQFIVVGEHEFRDAHRIILVDHGYDPIL